MRTLIFLLLFCCTASAQTVVTFSIRGKLSSHGYTEQQLKEAIPKAFAYFERAANVDLQLVPSGGQYTITSGTLHLGGGYHARGWFNGNAISLHNGIVPGNMRTPDKPKVDTLWKAFGSEQAIASVLAHEIGHTPSFFGTAHSGDTRCLMHSNASVGELCPAEKAKLVARYGKAPIKNWSWKNPANALDVNNDGRVSSLDALTVINAAARGEKVDPTKKPTTFYDVNDDGRISNVDGLLVANELNRPKS